jgi:glutamine synthetase
LKTLTQKASAGEIDTVLVVFPDTYGRLVGKRLTAPLLPGALCRRRDAWVQLSLTVNLEMDPLDGFKLASWEQGSATSREAGSFDTALLPWQKGAAMVICDVEREDSKLVEEARALSASAAGRSIGQSGLVCNIASELEFFLFWRDVS